MNLLLAQTTDVGVGAGIAVFGVIALVVIALTAFWIVGLVDVIKREDDELRAGTKLLWILLMVFIGAPATLVYWLAAKPKKA